MTLEQIKGNAKQVVEVKSPAEAGARTIAQNEASCVVFGMPKEAIERGAAEIVVPLSDITQTIINLAGSPQAALQS